MCIAGMHVFPNMELKCTLIVFGVFLLSSESHGCGVGFQRKKGACKDEDECVTPSPCGENARCVNTDGSYYCTCNDGFRSTSNTSNFTETTGQCVDVDECYENTHTHTCTGDLVCVNSAGSYNCTCPEGYDRDPALNSTCKDVDECVSSVCGAHTSCVNTPGNFSCICTPGFDKLENGTCTDIDECKDPDVCGTNASCTNLPGGFICECHMGYSNYGNNQSKCTEISQMRFCV